MPDDAGGPRFSSSMIDTKGMLALFRSSRTEAALMMVTFVGVVFVGVLAGVVIAVGLSLVVFVLKAITPYRTELVAVEGVPGFQGVTRHPDGKKNSKAYQRQTCEIRAGDPSRAGPALSDAGGRRRRLAPGPEIRLGAGGGLSPQLRGSG